MVSALLVGLVVGFVLAMPPGPLAIAILRQALAGQTRAGVAMALGAAAMDSVYALIAGWASSALVGSLQGTVRDHAWGLLAFQGACIGFCRKFCSGSHAGTVAPVCRGD
jgi:LysE type translocator